MLDAKDPEMNPPASSSGDLLFRRPARVSGRKESGHESAGRLFFGGGLLDAKGQEINPPASSSGPPFFEAARTCFWTPLF